MFFYKEIEICPNCNEKKEFTYRKITEAVKVSDVCEDCLKLNTLKKQSIQKDLEKNERISVKETLRRIAVNYTHDTDKQSGIPILINDKAIDQKLKQLMKHLIDQRKGFFLHGISGSGKTTLMQLFAYQLLMKPGKNGLIRFDECIFSTEANLVSKVFQSAKEDFDWNFQLAVNHLLKHKRFIFMDELGAKKMRDKELEIIDLLFHYFEEQKDRLFLFCTSNRTIQAMNEVYLRETDFNPESSDVANRIISRLYGLVIPVSSEKKDYRRL